MKQIYLSVENGLFSVESIYLPMLLEVLQMVSKQHTNTYLIKNKLISIDLNGKGKARSCKPPIGKKKMMV
jgi:hypothetical protein